MRAAGWCLFAGWSLTAALALSCQPFGAADADPTSDDAGRSDDALGPDDGALPVDAAADAGGDGAAPADASPPDPAADASLGPFCNGPGGLMRIGETRYFCSDFDSVLDPFGGWMPSPPPTGFILDTTSYVSPTNSAVASTIMGSSTTSTSLVTVLPSFTKAANGIRLTFSLVVNTTPSATDTFTVVQLSSDSNGQQGLELLNGVWTIFGFGSPVSVTLQKGWNDLVIEVDGPTAHAMVNGALFALGGMAQAPFSGITLTIGIVPSPTGAVLSRTLHFDNVALFGH